MSVWAMKAEYKFGSHWKKCGSVLIFYRKLEVEAIKETVAIPQAFSPRRCGILSVRLVAIDQSHCQETGLRVCSVASGSI